MKMLVDLSRLPAEVREGVRAGAEREDLVRHKLGVLEQARLKQLHDQLAVSGFNTDIGRQSMVLSQDQWQRCMDVYGQRCFADPGFAKWLLKQHEDFRVKDVGTRIQSGYTGMAQSSKLKAQSSNG